MLTIIPETFELKFHHLVGAACAVFLACAALPALAGPIQPFLDNLVRKEKLPGAVLLVSGPQGRQIAVSGVANRETREPMSANTRFYIASSGKLVTAAVIQQMLLDRRFKLSDPIFGWVKDIKGIGKLRNVRTATIEQLLKHRSGLAEYYTDDFEEAAAGQPDKRWSVEESLGFAFGEEAMSKAGREYNYSDTNYVLLGRLIEQVDQAAYAASVLRRIFDPLGLTSTTIGATRGDAGLAHGYAAAGRNQFEDVSYLGWNAITGDGAVVTTVSDYETFLLALFRDARLLPAKVVAQMCSAQAEDPDSGYGLGCMVEDTPWGEAWGHDGSISGFNAETWYIPEIGVTVVFFTNGDFKSDDPDIVVKAVKAYLKK